LPAPPLPLVPPLAPSVLPLYAEPPPRGQGWALVGCVMRPGRVRAQPRAPRAPHSTPTAKQALMCAGLHVHRLVCGVAGARGARVAGGAQCTPPVCVSGATVMSHASMGCWAARRHAFRCLHACLLLYKCAQTALNTAELCAPNGRRAARGAPSTTRRA
jgi:hypothetical protein